MKSFKLLHKDGKARVGQLETAHGVIETPSFNPVGTQATVKALPPKDLKEIGVQIILANTYHLMLRPGADLIERFGGLHKFMGWDKPIMTDSGGFQVFSLSRLNKITEEGVTFQSHLDGSRHLLTPEKSIQVQHQLGADLIVAFDDHESLFHSKKEMKRSLELTEKWALRSVEAHKKHHSLLYGVIHGGTHQDLRVRSARFTDKYFDAIAIGGIYGDTQTLCQIIEWSLGEVSDEKPRHLLGIGEVRDLFNGIERGIDFFDCVAPTRRARNGSLYIFPNSILNIRQSKFISDKKPVDPHCNCYTCANFTRSYLRHLYMADEILFHFLATYHNVYFITNLMKQIREAIKEGRFTKLRGAYLTPL